MFACRGQGQVLERSWTDTVASSKKMPATFCTDSTSACASTPWSCYLSHWRRKAVKARPTRRTRCGACLNYAERPLWCMARSTWLWLLQLLQLLLLPPLHRSPRATQRLGPLPSCWCTNKLTRCHSGGVHATCPCADHMVHSRPCWLPCVVIAERQFLCAP